MSLDTITSTRQDRPRSLKAPWTASLSWQVGFFLSTLRPDHDVFPDLKFVDVPRGQSITVTLKKEGTGLGFSLEGGKDSPYGDRPMTVKKIFTG